MGNSAKLLLHYIHKRRYDVKKSAGQTPAPIRIPQLFSGIDHLEATSNLLKIFLTLLLISSSVNLV
jgi:hypothetical protein